MSTPRTALLAAVLAGLVLWVYAGALDNGFVDYDDDDYVTENALVAEGLTPAGARQAFGFRASNWHPLTWLSHMLDVELFGLEPRGHHLTSVLLHAATAVLLFLFLAFHTRALLPGFLVAALFALHPLRVESVAWVSERKDVLSGLFFVLALLAHGRHARRPGFGRYLVLVAAVAAGLASKPMLVTLPFVLLLVDRWPLDRWRSGAARGLVLEKLPLFALALASSAATVAAQRSGGAVSTLGAFPPGERLANAALAALEYVGRTVWPVGLAVFHPHPALLDPEGAGARAALGAVAGLALLAVTALAVRLARRRPSLLVGWLWYLGMLVPVVGLVQVGAQRIAERYAYLPTVGLYLAGAYGLWDVARQRAGGSRVLSLAAIPVLAACAFSTRALVGVWRDSETLFRHALAVTERNFMAHNNLGVALNRAGRHAEAAGHFEQAVALFPPYAEAHNNLGSARLRLGDPMGAEASLREALALQPGFALAHFNLGLARARQGDDAGAVRSYGEALSIDPGLSSAHVNLSASLHRLGRTAEAIDVLRDLLRASPEHARAHLNLAHLLAGTGEEAEAARHFRRVLALVPDGPDAANAASALAWILATSPRAELRDGPEAVRLAERASAAAGHRMPEFLATLAAARAAAGDFAGAGEAQERALELAPEELRAEYGRRLERYRAGEPWRR